MKKKNNNKSGCCRAKIRFSDPAPDFLGDNYPLIGTCYAICTKCNEPCNFYIPIRRTWARNPKTQIMPNKKKKKSAKLTPKELKEIHTTQDF